MPNVLRMAGRVLLLFVAFDVVGVVLTLLVDLLAGLHRVWEASAPLGYAIWFVVGVLCAVFVYMGSGAGDDSPEARRTGTQLVFVTATVAALLAAASSRVWSASEGTVPVVPDHRGITLTYLSTVALVVAWARFVLFREGAASGTDSTPPISRTKLGRSLRQIVTPPPARSEPDSSAFKPAGFWLTLAFISGVPALLFLDASMFLLGPFDVFDPWTDTILSTCLGGGLALGIAAARWQAPRELLLAGHAPLLIGSIFFLFALILGGVLVAIGVPPIVVDWLSYIAFGLGFLLGCGALVGSVAELIERPDSGPAIRP